MDFIKEYVLVKEVVMPSIIIVFGFLLYIIISTSIKHIFKKAKHIEKRRAKTLCSMINNIIKYIILIICILSILEVYGISTKGFIASLGIAGVVAGLAFQDTLKDLLSGFSIIFENIYAVGDTVTIGKYKGKVISLGLKTTKLESINGEIISISNSSITEVVNHSLSNHIEYFSVPVHYKSDLEKVEIVIKETLKQIKDDNLIDVSLLGLDELDSSSINYRIRLETSEGNQFALKRKILKEIKKSFDKEKIEIPYNQLVIHNEWI